MKQTWNNPQIVKYGRVEHLTQQAKNFGIKDGFVVVPVPTPVGDVPITIGSGDPLS